MQISDYRILRFSQIRDYESEPPASEIAFKVKFSKNYLDRYYARRVNSQKGSEQGRWELNLVKSTAKVNHRFLFVEVVTANYAAQKNRVVTGVQALEFVALNISNNVSQNGNPGFGQPVFRVGKTRGTVQLWVGEAKSEIALVFIQDIDDERTGLAEHGVAGGLFVDADENQRRFQRNGAESAHRQTMYVFTIAGSNNRNAAGKFAK